MPIRKIQWDIDAWDDYTYWQTQDKKNSKEDKSACEGHKQKSI